MNKKSLIWFPVAAGISMGCLATCLFAMVIAQNVFEERPNNIGIEETMLYGAFAAGTGFFAALTICLVFYALGKPLSPDQGETQDTEKQFI